MNTIRFWPLSLLRAQSRHYTVKIIGRGAFGLAILVEEAGTQRNYVAQLMDLSAMSPKVRSFAVSEVR